MLYTWFCQICRNVVADHYRRNSRRSRVVLLEDLPDARAILESFAAPEADSRRPACCASRSTASSRPRSTRCRAVSEALEWKYIDGLSVRASQRLSLGERPPSRC